jgi:hypothetical protein
VNIALLVARLLLALVFATAGAAKLADRKGSRQAIIDFGVPSSISAPLGLLLPLAELAVAASILPASTPWWVGGPGGAGAPLGVRSRHLRQPRSQPQARESLLRAAALRPSRLEDARA